MTVAHGKHLGTVVRVKTPQGSFTVCVPFKGTPKLTRIGGDLRQVREELIAAVDSCTVATSVWVEGWHDVEGAST